MTTITAILGTVHQKCGVDFSSYRAPTVERRIRNRMISLGVTSLADYHRLLVDSAEEAHQLIERITIKVSRFYRNRNVFDSLRSELLPKLQQLDRPVRFWSAGCGRGEEPYTLAMLLEEAGIDGTIVATDVDPLCLSLARVGVFPQQSAAELPGSLKERFLTPMKLRSVDHLAVSEAIKSRVIFTAGDLTQLPASAQEAYDLICCRNVLIYWNAKLQSRMLRGLLANLRVGGLICLGEAEWPDSNIAARLEPLGMKLRIFRKLPPEVRS